MNLYLLLQTLLVHTLIHVIECQNAADNVGREFVVAFMRNEVETPSGLPLELFITTARTIPVQVEVTAPLYTPQTINIQTTVVSGQVEKVELPSELRLDWVGIYSKVIRVVGEYDIVVYGVNKELYSTDGFLVFPTDTIGYEYYTISYSPTALYSEFAIAARYDSTHVSIDLPNRRNTIPVRVVWDGRTYAGGDRINITLQAFEAFQCLSLDSADLSTTRILADKPVAVFSGNTRTYVGEATSRDHLAIQLPPLAAFGRLFPIIPTPNRTIGDRVRIIASVAPTTIVVSNNRVEFHEIGTVGHVLDLFIPSDQFTLISSTHPLLVAQVAQSQTADEPGDPTMLSVTAVSQFTADYSFATPTGSAGDSYTNWLMVMVRSSDVNGLLFDGRPFRNLNPSWKSFPGDSDLVGCQVRIAQGAHRLRHSSPVATFSGYLYGTVDRESYSFQIGSRMALINQPCIETDPTLGDGLDNDCDGFVDEEICTGASLNSDTDGDGLLNEDCALTREVADGAPDAGGRQFLIVFMENSLSRYLSNEIYVTAVRTAKVAVQVDSPMWFEPYIHLSAEVSLGSVRKFNIPYTMRLQGSSESSRALFVTADSDIIVFGVNREQYSSDAFLALPIDVMGKQYYAVTYWPNSDSSQCQIAVVGIHDGTRVDIALPPEREVRVELDGQVYARGQTITRAINRFTTLQIQSRNDLSGSHITSSQAICVYSGNVRTAVGSGSSRDHLVAMLPAVESWGRQFFITPIPGRTAEYFIQVVASSDDTHLTTTNKDDVTLSSGQSHLFSVPHDSFISLSANKPILVTQYSQSQQSNDEPGDPTMILVPSVEQWSNYYTFSTITNTYSETVYTDYVMLVSATNSTEGIYFDGQVMPERFITWFPINTLYSGAYFFVSPGVHTLQQVDPTITFSVIVYANADRESYGFAAGMRLAPINAPCETSFALEGDGIDNDCDGRIDEEICEGEAKFIDDDGDSLFNEDCAIYTPPITLPPPRETTTPLSTTTPPTTTPFVIIGPPGAAGPSGRPGLPGPQGLPGYNGHNGVKGTNGSPGSNGVDGETGATGVIGEAGHPGSTGSAGSTGFQGRIGPTGPEGNRGAIGATGLQGPPGNNLNGETGSTGVRGFTGFSGDAGSTGAVGVSGVQGPPGDIGGTKGTGSHGETGSKGDQGLMYQDIDECQTGAQTCSHECINTIGSYTCACPGGLLLGPDQRICQDIDECVDSNGGCDQSCTNMIGSFNCSCDQFGFRLANDDKTCIDLDECLEETPCENDSMCYNTIGSYHCLNSTLFQVTVTQVVSQCRPGYTFGPELDCIQERVNCSVYNGGCTDVCQTSTDQSVICSCSNPGYRLHSDGHTCVDYNECLEVVSRCSADQLCVNSEGGYVCLNNTITAMASPEALEGATSGLVTGDLLFAILLWLLFLSIILIGLLVFIAYQTRRHAAVKRHYRLDLNDLYSILQEDGMRQHVQSYYQRRSVSTISGQEDYRTAESVSAPSMLDYAL